MNKNNDSVSLEQRLHNEVQEGLLNTTNSKINDIDLQNGNQVISYADAAALCQYVYASNPLYPNGRVKYKTESKSKNDSNGWIPYIIDESKNSKWTNLKNGISGLLGNGAFIGYSTTSNSDFENALDMQSSKHEEKKYSSTELFGLLGGRIESISMNAEELFSILKGRLKRTRIGFRSMLFYQKDTSNGGIKRIAYVTEGSKSGMDIFGGGIKGTVDWFGDWILSNASQGISGLSPQHTLSIQNAKILDQICSSKGINLCFVGHSLGGGLAVSNAIATNRPAVVFDMAGIHGFRRLKYKNIHSMNLGSDLVNFYVKGEFLSTKGYEMIGPNHISQSVEIEYNKGKHNYDVFTLHNFIFFCKYFKLSLLEDESNISEFGI